MKIKAIRFQLFKHNQLSQIIGFISTKLGGMSYSNSSHHDYNMANASQINVTRIDGDARQLSAEEYRKVIVYNS